ncbi:hypothetical protein [Methanorbis furvi]|uniref:Uncharacterized protein n=1 Tax=Methanorbis furvi TaxID=3028299 RepID=A0AAE4MBB4_9EURY|nr:hypothetical protein [Methanocorpusculaceae archaeon Ag1]
MARWNNFKSKARSYGGRAYSGARTYGRKFGGYARRGGRAAWNANKRASQGFGNSQFKVYPDLTVAAGAAVGLSDIDRMVPGQLWLLGAAMPIGGSIGRKVRNFCGGVIIGELISQYTGVKIPLGTAQTKNTTNMSVAALYSA